MFADDVQIYWSGSRNELPQTVIKINSGTWTINNGLLLNASKTQAVAINNKNNVYIPQITRNGTAIEYTAYVKKVLFLTRNLTLEITQHQL